MSADRLIEAVSRCKNPTALGLDPRLDMLPPELVNRHIAEHGETLEAGAAAFLEFNRALLERLNGLVPAVKFQSACYEALGVAGMQALRDSLIFAAELGYYVILDGKRGDIGSTSACYSAAFLGETVVGSTACRPFPADALTVNPYQGSDNLNEFLRDCKAFDRMVFVLCKTSNPSSIELQELMVGDRPLYRAVAEQIDAAGHTTVGESGYGAAGIVVGANHPAQLSELRKRYPRLYFLVPGYGAQGGRAVDIAGGFDRYGRGVIVNNSRGLMCAWKSEPDMHYADAAYQAAQIMRNDFRANLSMV